MIQISTPVAVTLLLAIIGLVFAFGRILLAQFDQRMSDRFKAQDQARELQLQAVTRAQTEDRERIASLVEKMDALNRELPLAYVRREDHIRFSAVIDHKLDRLAELVMQLMRGSRNGD